MATFYRSTHILPGSGKHGVVLALPQGSRRDRTFIVVRPNTGRQPKPMPADVFASRSAPKSKPGNVGTGLVKNKFAGVCCDLADIRKKCASHWRYVLCGQT